MDIKTLGLRPFKIEKFHKVVKDKLYSGGLVSYPEYDDQPNFDLEVQLRARLEQLFKLIGLKRSLDKITSFDIAHYIGLTPKEEYQLLATPKEEDRQTLLINHIDRILPMIIRAQRIRDKLQMNGHFKNLDILDF